MKEDMELDVRSVGSAGKSNIGQGMSENLSDDKGGGMLERSFQLSS